MTKKTLIILALLLAPPAMAQQTKAITLPAPVVQKPNIARRVVNTSVSWTKTVALATKNTVLHPVQTIKTLPKNTSETFKKIDTAVLDTNDKFDRHVKLIGNVGTLLGTYFVGRNFLKTVGQKETVVLQ